MPRPAEAEIQELKRQAKALGIPLTLRQIFRAIFTTFILGVALGTFIGFILGAVLGK